MQYQTFRGTDLKEAISLVRAAFGSNAVIGSTRAVPKNQSPLSTPYVEVSAAPAPDLDLDAPPKKPEVKRRYGQKSEGPRAKAQLLERELRVLRAMVDELADEHRADQLAESLLHHAGIEGQLARMLANGAPHQPRLPELSPRSSVIQYLRGRLASALSFSESPLELAGPRIITCIGPSGAGKTTTLAKLAARARLEVKRKVSVITLDTFRVGAVAQWERYSQILGMPMGVAHDAESFKRLLRAHTADLVLVDTAGRSSDRAWQDPRVVECLRQTSLPADVLLVVPAWLRARDAERLTEIYETPEPTGLIITKLDETDCMGGSLHAAVEGGLPLTYLCDGPKVPEDIHSATIGRILSGLFAVE